MRTHFVIVGLFAGLTLFAANPGFLTFDELVTLSDTDHPAAELSEKVAALLRTPFSGDEAALSGAQPHRPTVDGLGPVVRVVSWNVERGLNFNLIRLAFSDSEGFKKEVQRTSPLDPEKMNQIEQRLRTLGDADIIILNEVDLGMKRTDYLDVARELARHLKMNYVFGVEFVELDKLDDLGVEKIRLDESELADQPERTETGRCPL